MKVILLGLNHEVQWKDPTGHLRQVLSQHVESHGVDLFAEEAAGLPTTVAQRLAYKLDKPWMDIDMSVPERKIAGIYEALISRRADPIDPYENIGSQCLYLPEEDGIRETEWVRRMLTHRASVVLCLCGFMHTGPFSGKLIEKGCDVELVNVTDSAWFQHLYGKYQMLTKDGESWCEMRRPQTQ